MTRSVKLLGLDCGSTTTSCIVAGAQLTPGAVGRVEITHVEPIFRSPLVFTPFADRTIDAEQLSELLEQWLSAAHTAAQEIFGGGALITGLAAQQENARAIAGLLESRLGDSIVAASDDPSLESWLAFMGNCLALSRANPAMPFLNLDIGGGTTNLALGSGGQVQATGCLLVGARHFQFEPGTYRLTHISPQAGELLQELCIQRSVGQSMTEPEVQRILDFYVQLIESTVVGDGEMLTSPIAQRHVQVPLAIAPTDQPPTITLSGGVGQLVYDRLRGRCETAVTRFGDLGDELAARLARSPAIVDRMGGFVPEGLGRATVYGLLRHGTELSGATLYLPQPERLPLKNVPIVGRIRETSTDDELQRALALTAHSAPAGGLRIEIGAPTHDSVRRLGERIFEAMPRQGATNTLVLLLDGNLGKTLGNYITRWGTHAVDLIVVDEIADRDAQFVRLGAAREGIVPVSLYGMGPEPRSP